MNKLFYFACALCFTACQSAHKPSTTQPFPQVAADAETPAVRASPGADAADDPAIWIHPTDPNRSVIIGTVKHYGLETYRLDGTLLHTYPIGNPNNVDVRSGFRLGNGQIVDLIVFSDRKTNELVVYTINPTDLKLSELPVGRIKSKLNEVYGICGYHNQKAGTFYVFLNGKDGTVQQFELLTSGTNGIRGELRRSMKLQTQPEGMVADDALAMVYFGEEDKGIWRVAAEPDAPAKPELLEQSTALNPKIKFDIEGLAIFPTSKNKGYLLASSQGNNSYAVFERQDSNRYLGSFSIGDFEIDGTSETDGIEAMPLPKGTPFGDGLFVAQDGHNLDSQGKKQAQNFKFVSWSKIEAVLRKL